MLAGRTSALLALSFAGVACGAFGSGSDDDAGASDAATGSDVIASGDAALDAGPADGGADASACRATGRPVVDVAYGQSAVFPFPVRRAAVAPSGDVYGVAQRPCPDGGSGGSLARIGRDGAASGPIGCLADETAWAVAADSGGALVGTTFGANPARVRLWRVSLAGAATRLDDFSNTGISPPDPLFRTPYPTLVFQSGSVTGWGGFLEAQVGSPRLKGVLRVTTGGAWFSVQAPVSTEVPLAVAARGTSLLFAFASEGESGSPGYLVLRRFNVASTLSEDAAFSAGGRTKLTLPQPLTVTLGGPVRSLVWTGDTVTLVTPGNGSDAAITVFRDPGGASSPATFVGTEPRVTGACDSSVLIATSAGGGSIDVLRFASGALGWSGGVAPPRLTGLGGLVGFSTADDGFAYVVGTTRATRLTP
jgi:hypothetical protein